MDNNTLIQLLIKLNVCSEAIKWIEKDKLTLKQAWFKCKRADWLVWFAGKTNMVTHQKIVLVACACAETAFKYLPKGENRPQKAIEAAKRWAKEPTEENRKAADAAADAAYAAAYAADAAHAAEYAAHAAVYAAYAAAQKKLCKIVRKMIKFKEL